MLNQGGHMSAKSRKCQKKYVPRIHTYVIRIYSCMIQEMYIPYIFLIYFTCITFMKDICKIHIIYTKQLYVTYNYFHMEY